MPGDPYAKFGGTVDPYAKFGGAVATDAGASVPGMERLGGVAPGPPKAPGPAAIAADSQPPIVGEGFQNPRTGRISRGAPVGSGAGVLLDQPILGVPKMAAGVEQAANPYPKPGLSPGTRTPPSAVDQIAGGTSKVIRGAMQVASPAMIGAAAVAPLPVAAGLIAGSGAGAVAHAGLKASGAPEGVQDLGEDIAGLAVGGWAAKKTPGVADIRAKFARDPKDSMVRGIKPAATNTNFATNLDRSLPELKVTELEMGRKIENIGDLLDGIDAAKKRVWGQYRGIAEQPSIDPYTKQPIVGASRAEAQVDMTPMAEAMEATISPKLRRENPRAAQAIIALAKNYRTTAPMAEVESILKTTNAELEGYYNKYPTAQRAMLTKPAGSRNAIPQIAVKEAQASAARDVIYNALDDAGEGAAPRELKQRYGALMNLEREVYRRQNVAARQQPDSLSEQMGRWSGAGKVVKGLLTGNPADVAMGVAERQMAKWAKEQQTTDALIKSAMANYRGSPAPVNAPAPFQPKALLNGPNQAGGTMYPPPPPDTSGGRVRGNAPHEELDRMRKALPQGTAPFTQGVVVPEIKGRDTTGHQYLLDAPRPGQAPVNVLPRGPASVQGPPYEPSERGRPRPLGPANDSAALLATIEDLKAQNAQLKANRQGPPSVQQ